ncbi:MAG TPA: hypothetical protein VK933_15695 [Longimicrobiales bacterium]|nr:hypothetical protein [Longimicrobiales bacterium]
MRKRGLILAIAATLLLPVLPVAVHAQDGFMFGRPKAQLTLRAGPMLHRAEGDLLGFFQSELTLDRGDFRAPAISAEVAAVIHPRVDLALGAGWSNVETSSEFRDFVEEVDGVDVPIEQTTALRVMPVTASVRFYPLARGHGISELAWVPARTTPYLGGGAGLAFYRLRQYGDFVSDTDLSIFSDDWESSGYATTGQLFAGIDHWLSPRVGLNIEGRYMFGSAKPDNDFVGWDSIDLSGLQLGIGLALRW